jgi:hypothetical protein
VLFAIPSASVLAQVLQPTAPSEIPNTETMTKLRHQAMAWVLQWTCKSVQGKGEALPYNSHALITTGSQYRQPGDAVAWHLAAAEQQRFQTPSPRLNTYEYSRQNTGDVEHVLISNIAADKTQKMQSTYWLLISNRLTWLLAPDYGLHISSQ